MGDIISTLKGIISEHKAIVFSDQTADGIFIGDFGKAIPVGIQYNASKANISLKCRIDGKAVLPEDKPIGLPSEMETKVWRALKVVYDGRLVLDAVEFSDGGRLVLNGLPLVEESRMGEDEFFRDYLEYMSKKAVLKVYEHYYEGRSDLARKYGPENAEYLRGIGLTDFGYSDPCRGRAEPDDSDVFEMIPMVAGLSCVPSYNQFRKSCEKGRRLNYLEGMMESADSCCKVFCGEGGVDEELVGDIVRRERKTLADIEEKLAMRRIGWMGNGAWVTGHIDWHGNIRVGDEDRECRFRMKNPKA